MSFSQLTKPVRTYWDVYKELEKLANEAADASHELPVGSNDWYKAWGYAEGLRQACIQCLTDNTLEVNNNA